MINLQKYLASLIAHLEIKIAFKHWRVISKIDGQSFHFQLRKITWEPIK